MKTKLYPNKLRNLPFLIAIIFTITGVGKIDAQTESTDTNQSVEDKVIAMINSFNYNRSPNVTTDWGWEILSNATKHREKMIQSLIGIFNDPKSYVFRPKCYAAYCLGVMRASEAADSLAAQITIRGSEHGLEEPIGGYEPAVTALITIGTPSIPAVIRNLAESDDAKVRELSLQVLYHIEGDKDIVQLRLQKALAAEKDSQKQARLQSALKSLAEL
jgi:hypothetical protein